MVSHRVSSGRRRRLDIGLAEHRNTPGYASAGAANGLFFSLLLYFILFTPYHKFYITLSIFVSYFICSRLYRYY
jgi:hypothetical protein